MDKLPANLLSALSPSDRETTENWWATLSDSERREIIGLWDARLETAFFRPQADESGQTDDWEQVPAVRGGRFVPHDDDGRDEWVPGHIEYLLLNPERSFDPPLRCFYIRGTLCA